MSIWRSALRGPAGPQGPAGANGTNGTNGTNGANGAPGALVYDSSGLVANAKIWSGTVVTNGSGVWSVDFTNAGFTEVPRVTSNATLTGNAAANMVNTKTTAKSLTGASGIAASPTLAVLGLLSLSLVGAGVSVDVTAIGK